MPSSAATLAALRPLLRHNSSASFLYSSVYLALLRDGLLNCVFMWASFRVLTLCPLSVKSMQPYSDPFCNPFCSSASHYRACDLLSSSGGKRFFSSKGAALPPFNTTLPYLNLPIMGRKISKSTCNLAVVSRGWIVILTGLPTLFGLPIVLHTPS